MQHTLYSNIKCFDNKLQESFTGPSTRESKDQGAGGPAMMAIS